MTRDGRLLFATRFIRLFAYGLLAIVLVLYLSASGLSGGQAGLLLSLTLVGDIVVSLAVTTRADRLGRRKMLLFGALLMILTGIIFASTGSFVLLALTATIGVLSPSGNEVGPFLSIEQAALSQIVPKDRRTGLFAWYNLTGSVATALGSLAGGLLGGAFQRAGLEGAAAYRPVVFLYGLLGIPMLAAFAMLSPATEAPAEAPAGIPDPPPRGVIPLLAARAARPALPVRLGLRESSGIVARLSALFALDAFGGGFTLQSLLAWWFHVRFGLSPEALGGVFLGANLLAGASALSAGWLAARIGLVRTMVYTHLPSNILLILVPLMPTAGWAIAVLLLRFSISQMDVPTRQAYVMAVVPPGERSAAAGVTGVSRSLGASLSPMISARLLAVPGLMSLPFFLAGGIKIVYDLLIFGAFAALPPGQEK